ncbi:hypothetical protein GPROT2_02817 [Gammaproteobacteria bacterium]|nr:hypothetical protein GPROT2_02817 [Gammaproteobacteria bacterium]
MPAIVKRCVARRDARLHATVVGERQLFQRDTGGARLPLRGGSALAWFGGRLALVQDDADAVALVEPRDGRVTTVPVPRTADDPPRFDFEACVRFGSAAGPDTLLLLSSGSRKPPWRLAQLADPLRPRVAVRAADGLYAMLRAAGDFTGGVLNIEGALARGRGLRLFNRGGRGGFNASVDLPRQAFLPQSPGAGVMPGAARVTRYDLGMLDGIALGFTDVAAAPAGGTLFVAAAEDSAGATVDGAVAGSVAGIIRRGHARWIEIRDAAGALHGQKIEGLCLDPADPGRGWAVTDADDAGVPARLCRLEFHGPW